MSGHTEGPWQADGAEIWATSPMRFNLTSAGTPKIAVAIDHVGVEGGFPTEANARLLAASPDLLAACKALVGSVTQETERGRVYALGELSSAVDAARAAISKAEQP